MGEKKDVVEQAKEGWGMLWNVCRGTIRAPIIIGFCVVGAVVGGAVAAYKKKSK